MEVEQPRSRVRTGLAMRGVTADVAHTEPAFDSGGADEPFMSELVAAGEPR